VASSHDHDDPATSAHHPAGADDDGVDLAPSPATGDRPADDHATHDRATHDHAAAPPPAVDDHYDQPGSLKRRRGPTLAVS